MGSTYVEVLGVNVAMLGKVEVLLGHEHTLCSIRMYQVSESSSSIERINLRCESRTIGSRQQHTAEEVLVDLLAVFLGDKPAVILIPIRNQCRKP